MALDVDNLKGEVVRDPYHYKERYQSWDRTIKGVSGPNEAAIVAYLDDMRVGRNVNPKAVKGRRGYHRLASQRHRLAVIARLLEQHEQIDTIAPLDLSDVKRLEPAVSHVFARLDDGQYVRKNGKRYLGTRDLVKSFKAFWHWHMVVAKREHGALLPDITEYIVLREAAKPSFLYFGVPGSVDVEIGFRRLFEQAKHNYRALLAFMFDSGIRSPTELVNVKAKDLTPVPGTPFFQLHIRDETAKTFGRRIKLMLCHEALAAHLAEHALAPDDFVFPICPRIVNQYLKRLGERVLGKKGLTMYDFRHNAVCYFVPRYKNENALMYRFGWRDSKMIHYYSELLGMKDTLQQEDFLIDVTRAQVEKDLEAERRMRIQLDDELSHMKAQVASIHAFLNRVTENEDAVAAIARVAKENRVALPLLRN